MSKYRHTTSWHINFKTNCNNYKVQLTMFHPSSCPAVCMGGVPLGSHTSCREIIRLSDPMFFSFLIIPMWVRITETVIIQLFLSWGFQDIEYKELTKRSKFTYCYYNYFRQHVCNGILASYTDLIHFSPKVFWKIFLVHGPSSLAATPPLYPALIMANN